MHRRDRRSSLGLIILGMLSEGPMHAYRMQKLIEQRGKAKVVNVRQRASIYQALDRLLRLGLIEVRETIRPGNHPDRIVYAITEHGRETVREWLGQMLRTVGADFPEFPAALSVLMLLAPGEAGRQLRARAEAVEQELAELAADRRAGAGLPRLFYLEDEYRQALLGAELDWLRRVIADLDSGELRWNDEWLRHYVAVFNPEEREETHESEREHLDDDA